MKNNENFPYLVIEKRHNDFIFLDLNSLDIFAVFAKEKLNYQSLDALDALTLHFNDDQIKESIIKANVVPNPEDVSRGHLLIKVNKQKLPVMTKEVVDELNLPKWFMELFSGDSQKRYLNMIYNKLSSIIKKEEILLALKNSLDLMNFNEFYSLFSKLPYKAQRELYFYIYQDVLEKYKASSLKRKKEENN